MTCLRAGLFSKIKMMKQRNIKHLSLIVLGLVMSLQSLAQDDIEGVWFAGEGNTKVQISKDESGEYQGTIVWLKQPLNKKGKPYTDRMNPDESLRDRPILGLTMLENLTYKNGNWIGKIYSPKRGKTVDAILSIENAMELKLKVSYKGFTREKIWVRTELAE